MSTYSGWLRTGIQKLTEDLRVLVPQTNSRKSRVLDLTVLFEDTLCGRPFCPTRSSKVLETLSFCTPFHPVHCMNKYFWNLISLLWVSKYIYSNLSFICFRQSWQCCMLLLQTLFRILFSSKGTPHASWSKQIIISVLLCRCTCIQFTILSNVYECDLFIGWRISAACCLPAFWNCFFNVMVQDKKHCHLPFRRIIRQLHGLFCLRFIIPF